MKSLSFLLYLSILLVNNSVIPINAHIDIMPIAINCGNGIFCASSQTCMSNATGAGLIYACSPMSNAVRCMDSRFSCPTSFSCAENLKCVSNYTDSDSEIIDAVVNIEAFEVAEMRDFGYGLKPTSVSVCGPITNIFRLPNFCTCREARLGGDLMCTIGLQTYISLGASAWFFPCASPANFGYRAWVTTLGMSNSIGNTWTGSFSISRPIPGASFEIGRTNAGARIDLSGNVNRFVLSTRVDISVCASTGLGPFSWELCNPSVLNWLPVNILNGPRFDFSRFC